MTSKAGLFANCTLHDAVNEFRAPSGPYELEGAEEAEKLCLEAQGNNTKDSIKYVFVWAADDGPMTMFLEDTDVHQPAAAFGQNN
jgi:hypothetical protein